MHQQRMKAVTFASAGAPGDVLRVSEGYVPQPGPDDVLVRVDSRPIHPADLMFIENRYRIKPRLPQIAGLEGSGTVVARGAGATCAIGARVAFRSPGSWAEFAVVAQARLALVPAGVPADVAAQFSLNPVAAYGLLDELGARPGDWLAVNAASSSLVAIVAYLAERRDIHVVGIVRSATSHRCNFPSVDATGDQLAPALLAASGGRHFAGLLDSIGGASISDVLSALRPGATIVSYGVLEREPVRMANADMIYRNLTWKGFGVDHWLSLVQDRWPSIASTLWQAMADPDRPLPLPVRARHPLDAVLRAVAESTGEGRMGKVLLVG